MFTKPFHIVRGIVPADDPGDFQLQPGDDYWAVVDANGKPAAVYGTEAEAQRCRDFNTPQHMRTCKYASLS